jgi:hypothetical protein
VHGRAGGAPADGATHFRVGNKAMNDAEIRAHIRAAATGEPADTWRLTARMVRTCWPGGSNDHTDRAALAWLRYWRPERFGLELPECSCATQHCLLCN